MKRFLSSMGAIFTAFSLLIGGTALAESEPDLAVASSTYGWVLADATEDEAHNVTVQIMEAPSFEVKTYTSAYPLDNYNDLTDTYESEALVTVLTSDCFVEVMFNKAGEVVDMERIEQTGARNGGFSYYMDSAKYGGELTAPGGGPGRMVAQGWILQKDAEANTITIGDGNHLVNVFEETYTLAPDCKIYLVDNSWTNQGEAVIGTWAGVEGTFDDITLCPVEGPDGKCPGEIYHERERYTALCIFDGDYTTYGNGAVVNELYLFANATQLADGDLAEPNGVQYNGTTWLPVASKNDEKTNFSFNGACEPFEIMKDRMYHVGDSYTGIYLFVTDNGDLTLLDQGNATATYQYWLNIEKMGFDPREVDHILLTHGHGDHYQALYEFNSMINRYHVGKGDIDRDGQYLSVATSIQNATGFGYLGYPEIGPQLSDKSIRFLMTGWSAYDEWIDLGGGVEVMSFLTCGHSADAASFLFKVIATDKDEYFKEGDIVTFVYMGGYGATSKLTSGYARLAMTDGMQYIQSVMAPYAESISDYIYLLPQHLNHYPLLEIVASCKEKGIRLFDGWNEGLYEIVNTMEKRIATNFYQDVDDAYHAGTDRFSTEISPVVGWPVQPSSTAFETIQKYGPYKRAAGEYEVEVISAMVIQGFDMYMNKNEVFRGMTNMYGFDLGDGFVTGIDPHVDAHDKWFVQIVCHVHDDYEGKLDYETNFYGAENYAAQWTSGPIEIANRPAGSEWTEILRTVQTTSYEDAMEIYEAIKDGGVFDVNMTITSEIVIPEDASTTFVAK